MRLHAAAAHAGHALALGMRAHEREGSAKHRVVEVVMLAKEGNGCV